MTSVFSKYENQAWPYRFSATLHVHQIAGGTPANEKIAEAWLKTKLADSDSLIRQEVAEIMAERATDRDSAVKAAAINKHLVGFRKDDTGLWIGGRQVKAAVKEAASVARAADKLKPRWGTTSKGVLGFVAEHIMIVEDKIHLADANGNPVIAPSDVIQSFPINRITNQPGIQYQEIVEDAYLSFTVIADHAFTAKEWAMLWLTGEQQGIGATRSQGFGRYEVVRWEPSAKTAKALALIDDEDPIEA